jgi:hypothetical protein
MDLVHLIKNHLSTIGLHDEVLILIIMLINKSKLIFTCYLIRHLMSILQELSPMIH